MKWYALDAFDPRVVARGRWGDPIEDWPNAPGVFVVANPQLNVARVGYAATLAEATVSIGPDTRSALWLQTATVRAAEQLAERLIEKYRSE